MPGTPGSSLPRFSGEKDTTSSDLEKHLWDAADQFRANSGLKRIGTWLYCPSFIFEKSWYETPNRCKLSLIPYPRFKPTCPFHLGAYLMIEDWEFEITVDRRSIGLPF